ncbi:MAG: hypothetical protein WBA93_25590 [Microcoleaceae cyanobacterium]
MSANKMVWLRSEKVKKVYYTTIINWVKQIAKLLPNADRPKVISFYVWF